MKIVAYRNNDSHRKNKFAFKQMCKDMGFEYLECNDIINIPQDTDLIWSDSTIIPPTAVSEKTKIVFGPGLFIFPEPSHPVFYFDFRNKAYINCLNLLIKKTWYEFINGPRIDFVTCPFPVNMVEFCPRPDIPKTNDVLIYFKNRHPNILEKIINIINSLELSYQIIKYGSYQEKDYKDILVESKMCIWVGCCESQGFALQECLSTNVPILVLEAKSMFDETDPETGRMYYAEWIGRKKLEGSTASYWDDRCGIKTSDINLIPGLVKEMLGNIDKYQPRAFINDSLSSEACWKHWSSCLKNL